MEEKADKGLLFPNIEHRIKCGVVRTFILFPSGVLCGKQEFVDAKNVLLRLLYAKDLVIDATLFHMIGERDIYLENYKGILSYTCHEIIVKGHDCKYSICKGLSFYCIFSNEDMKISGPIEEVKVSGDCLAE